MKSAAMQKYQNLSKHEISIEKFFWGVTQHLFSYIGLENQCEMI